MTTFPSRNQIKKMLKKLEKVEGSHGLPPNADASDRFKYELCRRILIFKKDHNLTQREVAKLLGIDEARVSEILHYHIDKFSLDRLTQYNEVLYPKIEFKVA